MHVVAEDATLSAAARDAVFAGLSGAAVRLLQDLEEDPEERRVRLEVPEGGLFLRRVCVTFIGHLFYRGK